MTRFRSLLVTVGLLLALAVPAFAQTTLNSTTLAAAVTNENASQFQLASTSNISAGDLLAIVSGNVVREIALVRAVASPYVTVTRDEIALSTDRKARKHASGATVYTGARGRFYGTAGVADPAGPCTSSAETYLPHISLQTGFVYQCAAGGGSWYRLDQQFRIACRALLVADQIDQSCFTADGPLVVTGISFVSTTAEAGGTLTTIPRKHTSTDACASGTALATALSAVSATTAAQTVTSYTLSTTAAALQLSSGNRLCVDFTDDVAGELAGVTVTFTLAPR